MCLACGCDEPGRPRRPIQLRTASRPEPDELVLITTEDALARAEGWIGWDSPAVMSLGSAWTPNKVLRRISDHMVDHLCQIEARAAGLDPVPDLWRGRSITLDSDWARFTEQDLDEATARLRRMAQVLAVRLSALRSDWDAAAGDEWTIRAIAEHVGEATVTYASQLPAPAKHSPER